MLKRSDVVFLNKRSFDLRHKRWAAAGLALRCHAGQKANVVRQKTGQWPSHVSPKMTYKLHH